MAESINRPEVKLEAIKTLVALHGYRKAARLAGLNENTVKSWGKRYDWPAPTKRTDPIGAKLTVQTLQASSPLADLAPNQIISSELRTNEQESRLNLSRYLRKNSEKAVNIPDGLSITRKAKDLADIHKAIFPPETEQKAIVNLAVITGQFHPRKG